LRLRSLKRAALTVPLALSLAACGHSAARSDGGIEATTSGGTSVVVSVAQSQPESSATDSDLIGAWRLASVDGRPDLQENVDLVVFAVEIDAAGLATFNLSYEMRGLGYCGHVAGRLVVDSGHFTVPATIPVSNSGCVPEEVPALPALTDGLLSGGDMRTEGAILEVAVSGGTIYRFMRMDSTTRERSEPVPPTVTVGKTVSPAPPYTATPPFTAPPPTSP
jgi:hypothetical protein